MDRRFGPRRQGCPDVRDVPKSFERHGEGKMMRTLILTAALLAPFAVQAQTVEIGPNGFRVAPHGGGDCRELRAACMHKEELGETGMGNCQRYRELCASGARSSYHHRWHGYEEE